MTNGLLRTSIALLSCAVLMTTARAADAQWSIIGAAGIPDETSAGSVVLNDTASIALKPGAASAHIRYPVTSSVNKHVPCDGVAGDPDPCTTETEVLCLHVLARDTGSNARVVATLQRVDQRTGEMTALARFDSNRSAEFYTGDPFEKQGNTDYRAGAACVVEPISAPVFSGTPTFRYPATEIDLGDYSYFIDVTLSRSSSAGNPGVKSIRLRQDPY
jgi:hypothetical protein